MGSIMPVVGDGLADHTGHIRSIHTNKHGVLPPVLRRTVSLSQQQRNYRKKRRRGYCVSLHHRLRL